MQYEILKDFDVNSIQWKYCDANRQTKDGVSRYHNYKHKLLRNTKTLFIEKPISVVYTGVCTCNDSVYGYSYKEGPGFGNTNFEDKPKCMTNWMYEEKMNL